MTHLPYIAASYAVFAVIGAAVALSGLLRLRRAERRLAAIDPRRARGGAA